MKTGRSLQALAAQIETERTEKKDFVASTDKLEYDPNIGIRGAVRFSVGQTEYAAEPTNHALRQFGEHAKIPAPYMRRLEDHPDLLAKNLNHWFKNEPSKRMLRTLVNSKQVARAFLSDRYRPLENADLAEAVLPKLAEVGARVISSEITETRFYIQAATPRMELDLNALRRSGKKLSEIDPVQAGIVIRNSEVGLGSIGVESMIYKLGCFNGMIYGAGMRKAHLGRRTSTADLDDAAEYFTDATRELDDKAFWAKVVDVVNGIFDLGRFTSLVEKFAATSEVRLEAGAIETVELVAKHYALTEPEKKGVLDHLIEGGDLSLYGLVNAVTRTSTDVEDYDRAVEMERMGGDIIELPPTMWKKVS